MSGGCYRLGVIRIRKCRNPDIRNRGALDRRERPIVRSETDAVVVIQIARDSAYLSIRVRDIFKLYWCADTFPPIDDQSTSIGNPI